MKNVKEGDRVILIKAASVPCRGIPLWGSKYGCVGTAMYNAANGVGVRWDNGEISSFFLYKLELYNDGKIDPNIAFLHRKRGSK